MKKVLSVFVTALFLLVGCEEKKTTGIKNLGDSMIVKSDSVSSPADLNKNDTDVVVGNDRDAHGCIASAGYTWSVVSNKCIRLFESGIRLNPDGTGSNAATSSAFIVFSSDNKTAEMFLPANTGGQLLSFKSENGNETWQANGYKLATWKGGYTLEKDGKQIFAGHP